MSTHIDTKVVTRWECWCDLCDWHVETDDRGEVYNQRRQHETSHTWAERKANR